MPAVLVHGVPETSAVWNPLIGHLQRDDVVALDLPGFGNEPPQGFGATKEEYVDWLVRELDRIGRDGPIDLVGHDWGGGFVVRIVSTRPELVRSWVTDAAGLGDIDFEWHEFAKQWQTPGEGEQFFEMQMQAPVEMRAQMMEGFRIPHEHALEMVQWSDRTMNDCILALYRSAVDVGKEWGPDFRDIGKPGLVIVPSEDPFLPGGVARRGGVRAGARVVDFDGLGHWWMLEDPKRGVAGLEEFWASLD